MPELRVSQGRRHHQSAVIRVPQMKGVLSHATVRTETTSLLLFTRRRASVPDSEH